MKNQKRLSYYAGSNLYIDIRKDNVFDCLWNLFYLLENLMGHTEYI